MIINKYGCRKSEDVCLVHDCPLLGFDFCEDSEMIKDFKKLAEQEMLKRVEEMRDAPPPYSADKENPIKHIYQNQGYTRALDDLLSSLSPKSSEKAEEITNKE